MGDEVEAIDYMEVGLDLELMFNLTFKYVKELKHQGVWGGGHNLYDSTNKATLIALITDLLHKNLTKCCTQESFRMSGLVPSPKISLLYTPRPV